MLHPSSDLSCITIENVAPADQLLAIDERSFLAADVTEYRGGADATSAHTIILTQVKYSPLRPEMPWTVARLTRNERTGGRKKLRTSLLRKLANMLRPYARVQASRPRVVIRLLTNQPISDELREDLTDLRAALTVDFCRIDYPLVIELDGGQHLENVDADRERTAFLERLGSRVMRFWDNQVLTNTDAVLEAILEQLRANSTARLS